jgi:hypothetical protein
MIENNRQNLGATAMKWWCWSLSVPKIGGASHKMPLRASFLVFLPFKERINTFSKLG